MTEHGGAEGDGRGKERRTAKLMRPQGSIIGNNEDLSMQTSDKVGRLCLTRNGGWNYDHKPHSQTDEFIEATRFALHEAVARAIAKAEEGKA